MRDGIHGARDEQVQADEVAKEEEARVPATFWVGGAREGEEEEEEERRRQAAAERGGGRACRWRGRRSSR